MRTLTASSVIALLCLAGCPGPSTSPDAAAGTDAFSVNDAPPAADDAFSARDAFSAEDAFSATDAPSSTDAFVSGDACVQPTGVDLDGLGADCGDATCAEGLECLEDAGFALQHFCGISCEPVDGGACACPSGTVCGERTDKAGLHHECMRAE